MRYLHRASRQTQTMVDWARARHRLGKTGEGSRLGRPYLLTNPEHIEVGDRCYIRAGARLESVRRSPDAEPGLINVGSGTVIEGFAHIGAAYAVTIGEGCLIASHVTILDHDHLMPDTQAQTILDSGLRGSPIRIGRSVWIGEKATVLKGVTVGDRAIIGAHAVVTSDIPEGAVAIGVPARSRRRAG